LKEEIIADEEANNLETEAEPQGGVSLICLTKCAASFGSDAAGFITCTIECLNEETQGERSVDLMYIAKCAAGFGTDDAGYKKCVLECSTKEPEKEPKQEELKAKSPK
jgi:hypothetical protein